VEIRTRQAWPFIAVTANQIAEQLEPWDAPPHPIASSRLGLIPWSTILLICFVSHHQYSHFGILFYAWSRTHWQHVACLLVEISSASHPEFELPGDSLWPRLKKFRDIEIIMSNGLPLAMLQLCPMYRHPYQDIDLKWSLCRAERSSCKLRRQQFLSLRPFFRSLTPPHATENER